MLTVGQVAKTTPTSSPTPISVEMTLDDFLDRFQIPVSTFTRWRRLGRPVPRFKRLPNGQLRTRSDWVDAWFEALPDEAA